MGFVARAELARRLGLVAERQVGAGVGYIEPITPEVPAGAVARLRALLMEHGLLTEGDGGREDG